MNQGMILSNFNLSALTCWIFLTEFTYICIFYRTFTMRWWVQFLVENWDLGNILIAWFLMTSSKTRNQWISSHGVDLVPENVPNSATEAPIIIGQTFSNWYMALPPVSVNVEVDEHTKGHLAIIISDTLQPVESHQQTTVQREGCVISWSRVTRALQKISTSWYVKGTGSNSSSGEHQKSHPYYSHQSQFKTYRYTLSVLGIFSPYVSDPWHMKCNILTSLVD